MDSNCFLRAPVDSEGFVVTFNCEQGQEIRNFFEKYGFVCIRDVLTDSEIGKTCEEFFAQFDRDNEASIESFFGQQPFAKFGVIGKEPTLSTAMLNNRQNRKVYAAFSAIFETDELIVDHDRFGALRPTANHPKWKTIDRWLHLDCNPQTGAVAVESFGNGSVKHDWNNTFLVQGFLALTDAREPDGGFHCVPGGHKYALEWSKKVEKQGSTLVVDPDDPIREHIQKISVRKGCLLVWNSFLFHANRPNFSLNWRLVQYIRMYPAWLTPFTPLEPLTSSYPPDFKMTELGKKLFGIVF